MRTVLFVCVHNSGRSQMAEAFFNQMAAGKAQEGGASRAGMREGIKSVQPGRACLVNRKTKGESHG